MTHSTPPVVVVEIRQTATMAATTEGIQDSTIVRLCSNDNRTFEVTYKVAKQSATLKNMLDGVFCPRFVMSLGRQFMSSLPFPL